MVTLNPGIGGAIQDPTSRYEMKRRDAELLTKKYQQNVISENSEHGSIISKVKGFLAKIFGK